MADVGWLIYYRTKRGRWRLTWEWSEDGKEQQPTYADGMEEIIYRVLECFEENEAVEVAVVNCFHSAAYYITEHYGKMDGWAT